MQAIPTSTVTCSDGSIDTYVGINSNISSGDRVQAFVNCFKHFAQYASNICAGLPVKLILAQWGGESGWATGSTQKHNQNWSNIVYANANNPPGNNGSDIRGFAKFCGLTKHAYGYGCFFQKTYNPRYAELMDYLAFCRPQGIIPSETACARYIADAGYGGGNPDGYYHWLMAMMNTLCRHSDACQC